MKLQKIIKKLFVLFLPPEEGLDEIIANIRYDNYINEIQRDGFFAGNIEIGISCILFNLNISFYKLLNETDTVITHFMNVWKDINDSNNELMIVLFENNNHYRLISLKGKKYLDINLNHNLNDLGN